MVQCRHRGNDRELKPDQQRAKPDCPRFFKEKSHSEYRPEPPRFCPRRDASKSLRPGAVPADYRRRLARASGQRLFEPVADRCRRRARRLESQPSRRLHQPDGHRAWRLGDDSAGQRAGVRGAVRVARGKGLLDGRSEDQSDPGAERRRNLPMRRSDDHPRPPNRHRRGENERCAGPSRGFRHDDLPDFRLLSGFQAPSPDVCSTTLIRTEQSLQDGRIDHLRAFHQCI